MRRYRAGRVLRRPRRIGKYRLRIGRPARLPTRSPAPGLPGHGPWPAAVFDPGPAGLSRQDVPAHRGWRRESRSRNHSQVFPARCDGRAISSVGQARPIRLCCSQRHRIACCRWPGKLATRDSSKVHRDGNFPTSQKDSLAFGGSRATGRLQSCLRSLGRCDSRSHGKRCLFIPDCADGRSGC